MDETTKRAFRKLVGKNLQELRKGAGYSSAKAFAEEVGFNFNTYTQYEQGLSGFNYEQAWIMADALHCSMDQLGGREWPLEEVVDADMAARERKLVGDYRDTHDFYKPEIEHFAEDQAERHPKIETDSDPRRQMAQTA